MKICQLGFYRIAEDGLLPSRFKVFSRLAAAA